MTTRWIKATRIAAVFLLALGALLPTGCSNDTVAPHDPALALNITPAGAARLAGGIGWVVARVGWQLLEDPADGGFIGNKDALNFDGDVEGSCEINFTNDVGAAVPWNSATHGTLVTSGPLVFHADSVGLDADWGLQVDLAGDINQAAHRVVVGGTGAIIMGSYTYAFTMTGVTEVYHVFPTGGSVTVTMGTLTAVVTYSGGSTALITVGSQTWSLNLNNGEVTALP
jgi:hypothetical protein